MGWEALLLSILRAVADVAPGLLAAWTGRQTDQEALDHLEKLINGLPIREAGHAGTWDKDLQERIRRLEQEAADQAAASGIVPGPSSPIDVTTPVVPPNNPFDEGES